METAELVAPAAREPARRPPAPLTAMLVANLTPLLGVVFLHWNLGELMVLYWAESLILGVLHIVSTVLNYNGQRFNPAGGLLRLVVFGYLYVLYFVFWCTFGMAIMALFQVGDLVGVEAVFQQVFVEAEDPKFLSGMFQLGVAVFAGFVKTMQWGFVVPLLLLGASAVLDYCRQFGGEGERPYRRPSLLLLMGRTVGTMFLIIFLAFLFERGVGQVPAMIILVFFKILIELAQRRGIAPVVLTRKDPGTV